MISLYQPKKKSGQYRKRQSFPVIIDRKDKSRSEGGEFVDGDNSDDFTSTLRVKPTAISTFSQYMDANNIVYVSLKPKKISIFSGVSGRSPVEEINLGWKFAYISAMIGVPITLLSMLGEAYDVPHKMRDGIEWGIKWLATVLN